MRESAYPFCLPINLIREVFDASKEGYRLGVRVMECDLNARPTNA
jgi:hypothetical protein